MFQAGYADIKASLDHVLRLVWGTSDAPSIGSTLGVPLPHGILLYGPSGVGKTLLARAAAAEFKVAVFALGATSLVRGEMGESERILREIFAKANNTERAAIILDDMHVLFGSREDADSSVGRLLTSQLAMELDAAAEGVCNHTL